MQKSISKLSLSLVYKNHDDFFSYQKVLAHLKLEVWCRFEIVKYLQCETIRVDWCLITQENLQHIGENTQENSVSKLIYKCLWLVDVWTIMKDVHNISYIDSPTSTQMTDPYVSCNI